MTTTNLTQLEAVSLQLGGVTINLTQAELVSLGRTIPVVNLTQLAVVSLGTEFTGAAYTNLTQTELVAVQADQVTAPALTQSLLASVLYETAIGLATQVVIVLLSREYRYPVFTPPLRIPCFVAAVPFYISSRQ